MFCREKFFTAVRSYEMFYKGVACIDFNPNEVGCYENFFTLTNVNYDGGNNGYVQIYKCLESNSLTEKSGYPDPVTTETFVPFWTADGEPIEQDPSKIEIPITEPELPVIEPEPPVIEPEPPVIEPKPPVIEPEPPVTEPDDKKQ